MRNGCSGGWECGGYVAVRNKLSRTYKIKEGGVLEMCVDLLLSVCWSG